MNIKKLETGKLYNTTEYGIFELHECNRELRPDPALTESMRKHGFMPSCAIHVQRTSNNKLRVMRGHHRLIEAERLGLAVFFIVDDSDVEIYELEASSHSLWSVTDWVRAYANEGRDDFVLLQEFAKENGYSLGVAASLLSGESAGSHNKRKSIQRGTFQIGDMTHAIDIAEITNTCRELKIPFATKGSFIKAISAMLRLVAFDKDSFIRKVRTFPREMVNRSTYDDFLDEIERLYNRGLKDKKNLAFLAKENMKARQKTFGGKSNNKKGGK